MISTIVSSEIAGPKITVRMCALPGAYITYRYNAKDLIRRIKNWRANRPDLFRVRTDYGIEEVR
jgi:hypothetical protein